jgi:hypothetical protein
MLKVAASSKAEAECIARELDRFEPELSQAGRKWNVTVERDPDLPEILGALETCLVKNGIGSVPVTVNDRTYVMEPAA